MDSLLTVFVGYPIICCMSSEHVVSILLWGIQVDAIVTVCIRIIGYIHVRMQVRISILAICLAIIMAGFISWLLIRGGAVLCSNIVLWNSCDIVGLDLVGWSRLYSLERIHSVMGVNFRDRGNCVQIEIVITAGEYILVLAFHP